MSELSTFSLSFFSCRLCVEVEFKSKNKTFKNAFSLHMQNCLVMLKRLFNEVGNFDTLKYIISSLNVEIYDSL